MNEFDRRWQNCVARAREAPRRPDEMPFGFATRVLAGMSRGELEPSPTLLWERLGLRALACVTALLLLLGAAEYRDSRQPALTRPGVEHWVTQSLWML
jgi:hypothetical protein